MDGLDGLRNNESARGKLAMAKRIEIVGAKPKKIEITDKPKRRIEPAELGKALGANLAGKQSSANADLIGLAELGTQLLSRLRSSGGRPARADATEICRVPLSAADIKTLEGMVAEIEKSSGTKPSVGQLVSVIVRGYLGASNGPSVEHDLSTKSNEAQPVSRTVLQRMIDEQISPLREQIERLERQLFAAGGARQ
jgi:hypothetical protein